MADGSSSVGNAPGPVRVVLLTAVLCGIWGSTWVVIQGGLERLPPFGSAAARFTIAAICMSGLAAALAGREGGKAPTLRLSLVLGSLNFAASYGIVYFTETKLPSGLVSVLWASYPMIQAVMGHFFLRGERLGPGQSLGFVVGFLGVLCLFASDLRDVGPGAIGAGAVLLGSPLVASIGTTYVKTHPEVGSLRLNRNGMWIGAAMLWALALATERDAPVTIDRGAVLSVLYLSLVGTVTAFGVYFWLLRSTAANRLSVISYVTPAIALALGVVFRDERITAFTVGGLALILAGVFLVSRGRAGAA